MSKNLIMPSRLKHINEAIEGFDSTGVYMVSANEGVLSPAGFSDDQGLYLVAQLFRNIFNTNTHEFLWLFYSLTVIIGFTVGLLGLKLILTSTSARKFSTPVMAILACISFLIGDVYVMLFFCISLIPILIYALQAIPKKWTYVIIPIAGFLLHISNLIRGYSGTFVILFLVVYLCFQRGIKIKNLLLFIGLLAFGIIGSQLTQSSIINKRNSFLRESGYTGTLSKSHPKWHTIYIGLGYISSKEIPKYLDEVAIERVENIAPGTLYLSPEYESILKQSTFDFVKTNPGKFIEVIMAKAGVILLYLIAFGGIGVYLTLGYKMYAKAIPFIVGIGLNSVFGLLAVPRLSYLLGLICMASLYSLFMYDYSKMLKIQKH